MSAPRQRGDHTVHVHEQEAGVFNVSQNPKWYYACTCGVVGRFRNEPGEAFDNGTDHLAAAVPA